VSSLRSTLAAGAAALITLSLSSAVISPAGLMQPGPEPVPVVRDFTVTPAGGQAWTATVTTGDLDGGEALPAVDVALKGGGLPRFTPMAAIGPPGTYRLALPQAGPGEIRFALRIRTLPGSSPVPDFDDTYVRTLVRGETLHVVGPAPSVPSQAGTDTGIVLGGAGAMLVVAVICSMLAVRSRPPATARGR
jgi:hypothetical protein